MKIFGIIISSFFVAGILNASTLNVGLIGHYKFEGNVNDVNTSGNNLQLNGSTQFISTGHHGGQALRTNGDRSVWYNGGGYFTPGFLINNSSISAASFNFWTRNEASGGRYSPSNTEESYVEIGFGDLPPHIHLSTRALSSSGEIGVGHQLMNGVWQGSVSPTVNWADWKMVTLTISSTEYAAYLNGVEFDRRALDGSLFPSPNIRFGSHTWNQGSGSSARMDVEWDDMRIYNRALSSAEITQIYAAESVPEPSALSLLAVGLGVVLRRHRRTV
jgi:hypothetical protein